jgi:hypothetical protein
MPYGSYQQFQAERLKSAAEIGQADRQAGELSRALSAAWQQATRPARLLRHWTRSPFWAGDSPVETAHHDVAAHVGR